MTSRIIVHGGAGFWRSDIKLAKVGVENTAYMPWAYATESMKRPKAYERGEAAASSR